MIAALALVSAVVVAQPTQSETFGRVSGRVVLSGTSTGVEGAQVTLIPMRRPNPATAPMAVPPAAPPQRATDADGRFVFERIIPGEYRLNVQKSGLVWGSAPAPGVPALPPIVVTAGQPVAVADIAMSRGGAIAGRVFDSNGEPIADARVFALRRLPRGAAAFGGFAPAGPSVQTNDLGEFRLFGLGAGEYAVAAMPRTIGSTASPSTAKTTPTTTYFPSVTDPEAATALGVTAPDTINGIEIRLASVPAFRVTGIVVDASGAAVANAMVMLRPTNRVPIMGPAGNVRTGENGGFAIGGVPAGTYRVSAAPMVRTASGGSVFTFGPGPDGPAAAEVVVTDADVSGVRIVIQAR